MRGAGTWRLLNLLIGVAVLLSLLSEAFCAFQQPIQRQEKKSTALHFRLWRRQKKANNNNQSFFGSSQTIRDTLLAGGTSMDLERQAFFNRYGPNKDTVSIPKTPLFMRWRERILKVSNVASALCMVDCTVLPIVTVLMPLLGLAASPSQMEFLHELGHSIALCFVLPVGGLAATMNYLSHKRKWLGGLALMGLSMVYLANSCHAYGVTILSRFMPHELLHSFHHGLWHKLNNIGGCALLMGSNWYAHRFTCTHKNCYHVR